VTEDLPTLAEVQDRLDDALSAEPEQLESVDSEQMELRRAMGVA
jgi:hypothetical protein